MYIFKTEPSLAVLLLWPVFFPFIPTLSEGQEYYFSQTLEFITDDMIGFMLVIAQGLQVGEVRSCMWSAPSAAQPLLCGSAQSERSPLAKRVISQSLFWVLWA